MTSIIVPARNSFHCPGWVVGMARRWGIMMIEVDRRRHLTSLVVPRTLLTPNYVPYTHLTNKKAFRIIREHSL